MSEVYNPNAVLLWAGNAYWGGNVGDPMFTESEAYPGQISVTLADGRRWAYPPGYFGLWGWAFVLGVIGSMRRITVNVDKVKVDEKNRSFTGITYTVTDLEMIQRLRDAGIIE